MVGSSSSSGKPATTTGNQNAASKKTGLRSNTGNSFEALQGHESRDPAVLKLQQQMDAVQAQMATMAQRLTQVETENGELRQEVTKLQDDKNRLQTALDTLEQESAAKEAQYKQENSKLRSQLAASNVVVMGAAGASEASVAAAVQEAVPDLGEGAIEHIRKAGPVFVLHMGSRRAAGRVLAAKASINAAKGWRVRKDMTKEERAARDTHRDLLQSLWKQGALPRVHGDGQVYVKMTTGVKLHTEWDPRHRCPGVRVVEETAGGSGGN
jgi:DNA repair exonuclease SbcCD ATPase subunit